MNINDSNIRPELTFRRLVYLHMQQLTNFPYIEQDFDALTDYELLCLVVKYLNDVIDNSNEQNTSITNLYNAFLQLQTYMNNSVQELEDEWNNKTSELEDAWNDRTTELENEWNDKTTELETAFNNLQTWIDNYFDNLDVQDEIDNKLDEMLEDGVLEQIIEQFLQSTAVWCFDTVASMRQATNLTNGSYAKTLGYYEVNDGGGGLYKITNTTSNLYHQETLGTNLYANLIIENNTINIRQLGATSCIYSDITNKTDSKNYLLEYESLCTNNNNQYKLYIPNGLWFFSETLITRHLGVNIVGETNFSRSDYSGTIILPYQDNQAYIWKVGGVADYSNTSEIPVNQMVTQSNFENLTFSTGTYLNTLNYKVSISCLIFDRCSLFTIPNINIMHYNGVGLTLRSSWEFNIGNLMFRNQSGFNGGCMLWDNTSEVIGVPPNISAINIENMMCESNDGYLLYSAPDSGASHNHIGHINIENSFESGEQTEISSTTDFTNFVPVDLIKGFFRSLMIDSINYFQNNGNYTTFNNVSYYFRGLFATIEQSIDYNQRFNITVGSLQYRTPGSQYLKEVICYSHNSDAASSLNIGSLSFLDTPPNRLLFDYNYGIKTSIGSIVPDRLQYAIKNEYDAINYPGSGKSDSSPLTTNDKNLFYCDELSPSFLHLTKKSGGGVYALIFFNTVGANVKVRILYRTIDTTQTRAVYRNRTHSANTSISCPNSTTSYTWSAWSSGLAADINDEMGISFDGLSIAKIEYMLAE